MKLDRAIKLKMQAHTKINDIIHIGKICKQSSDEINQAFINMKAKLPKDTPQWLIYYHNGIYDTLVSQLYHYDLEYCYLVKGRLYSINKNSTRTYENVMTPKELHDNQESSGHYWINSDKPFFVSKTQED